VRKFDLKSAWPVLVGIPLGVLFALTLVRVEREEQKQVFVMNGGKVVCRSFETACGLRVYDCNDAPKIVLHCVHDLPEVLP